MISDIQQLEERLSRPTAGVMRTIEKSTGDFLVLGAAGKMGPTLTRMIKRAMDELGRGERVIAVSRFSALGSKAEFERHGIETIGADLLDFAALERLPRAANVIYMAGMKFGSSGQEAMTWAMNCFLPGMVCRAFAESRIVAFSTGNIYGLVDVKGGGSVEGDVPNPMGDYAMSCVGRERMFEHFSRTLGVRVSMIRLNYAVEMRYGVLMDVGLKVFKGEAIDLSMGYANVIWQGDANAMAICALADVESPPFLLNVTGPEKVSIRELATEFGRRFGREPVLVGSEAGSALLSDASKAIGRYGRPEVDLRQMIEWTANWIERGGPTLNKPTHFEARDGKF